MTSLAVALGIGLMLGVERERRKGVGPQRGPAGIRTFALVAVLGGIAQAVGGIAVVAVAGALWESPPWPPTSAAGRTTLG